MKSLQNASGAPSPLRIITTITDDAFVNDNQGNSALTGICIDLWRKTAKDLNLAYEIEIAGSWAEMVQAFKQNRADVIIQTMDDSQMNHESK